MAPKHVFNVRKAARAPFHKFDLKAVQDFCKQICLEKQIFAEFPHRFHSPHWGGDQHGSPTEAWRHLRTGQGPPHQAAQKEGHRGPINGKQFGTGKWKQKLMGKWADR